MKFSVVGTGNVAWHFSKMFTQQGHALQQLWARNDDRAARFAGEFNVEVVAGPNYFSPDNDFVLLAVKDDAIAEVSALISPEIFTIHPSGSTSIDALVQKRKGVAWSVQSLAKNVDTEYAAIPFLLEASDMEGEQLLRELFTPLSSKIYFTNSNDRARAHMAAVFACNFVNYMYGKAQEILDELKLPMEIILPSIDETAKRIHLQSAREVQTGPASRADMKSIAKHLEFLKDKPELLEIYRLLTNGILNTHHGKKL